MAENSPIDQTKILTYVIGAVLGYFGVVRPILKKTGVIQDAKAIDQQAQIEKNKGADKGNAWNPNYWKSVNNKDWLPWKAATALSEQIWDAKAPSTKNFFTDNEQSAIAAFNAIDTKKKLSMLSAAFSKLYNRDLYNFLDTFLSTGDLTAINNKLSNIK